MSPGDDGRFDVAPVAARRRVGPLVVVVVALAVVGAGLWKPWAAPEAARLAALPASSHVVPGPTGSTPRASSPNRRPPGADTPAAGDRPTFFGLNLASMGYRVERSSWGVAAAYVPLVEIVRAEAIDRPWVTPVVNWKSVAPDNHVRGPTLDRDETATVALAVDLAGRVRAAIRRARVHRAGRPGCGTGDAWPAPDGPARCRPAHPDVDGPGRVARDRGTPVRDALPAVRGRSRRNPPTG